VDVALLVLRLALAAVFAVAAAAKLLRHAQTVDTLARFGVPAWLTRVGGWLAAAGASNLDHRSVCLGDRPTTSTPPYDDVTLTGVGEAPPAR
jgi:hypothetical protein